MVALQDIGENAGALRCVTENNPFCCNRKGEFYYPNGSVVPVNRRGYGFYRNRQNAAKPPYIRLNKRPGVILPEGKYKCEIPYGDDLKYNICIRISTFGKLSCKTYSPFYFNNLHCILSIFCCCLHFQYQEAGLEVFKVSNNYMK